ncbi:MAG: deoxyribose-phosphate aldolase [Sulfobacillus benefaciens]|uniref:Deoxyribose-phosphate aldolase n=1 Tax=Sulfobacillus benefaciens TaxID=453960 RepID=A0A2T2XIY2_9FIRM|nr:MAG: deoxyribose-phosphate aldolase [Sulfobacillus benefaciens]
MTLEAAIDHSVLKPNATTEEIIHGAQLCMDYHFAAYCVNSSNVAVAADSLYGSQIPVAATIAFPFGSVTTNAKAQETYDAMRLGAREIDMVANIGWILENNWIGVTEDIKAVVDAASGAPVKVIIETGYLTRDHIRFAIEAIANAGAHYVKNSTGFGPKGADVEEMSWIRKVTPAHLGVKAAGGVRTRSQAVELINHGINRIGTSAGPALVKKGDNQ